MKQDKKKKFIDNGETIANMNVEGMPWYKSEKEQKKRKELMSLNISRHERRAMIWGAFLAYLPIYLIIIGSFGLIFLVLYIILNIIG